MIRLTDACCCCCFLQDKERRDAVAGDVTKHATELAALAKSHLAVSAMLWQFDRLELLCFFFFVSCVLDKFGMVLSIP
jgi:hypothetical protein